MSANEMRWQRGQVALVLSWDDHHAPAVTGFGVGDLELVVPPRPLVEVLTVGDGHSLANDRLVQTQVGRRSRYLGHATIDSTGGESLRIQTLDELTGLVATVTLDILGRTSVVRSSVEIHNTGSRPVALLSVASWAVGLGRPAGGESTGSQPIAMNAWSLLRGRSDWLAEGRWSREALGQDIFPSLGDELTGHSPRGCLWAASQGTWSTGHQLPIAALVSDTAVWAWQIEHNGGWRWEVGQDTLDGYLALSGPTDADHQWLTVLDPGERFWSVPVAVTVAPEPVSAIAQLTAYRRAARRPHPDNSAPRIVFNDYMNTLGGDPTTEKLLPLIDAAAGIGAEVFCIDAGWYDDDGDWWDSVGEWRPSVTRFPGGLAEVIGRIRALGMVPGLWLEPEVVGVNSPMAQRLPEAAFLQRAGQRVVEHQRYHLDLRHPAARAHLDAVVDRLIDRFGVGYFKLDYNINPRTGTDLDADSIGDGLLGHNRAHLAWLDALLDRHPQLIVENCGSGAMRADFAMTSRLHLQSTSDQQDPLRYPPIAASAPLLVLPEQAANWAYPQPGMTPEQIAFTLTTGLAGRFYLSGHLDKMSDSDLSLVREAVRFAHDLRSVLPTAVPFWPLDLPSWDGSWVALGYRTPTEGYLYAWSRTPDQADVTLDLAPLAPQGQELKVEQVFPGSLTAWPISWNQASASLQLHNPTGAAGARIFRISTGADIGACLDPQ